MKQIGFLCEINKIFEEKNGYKEKHSSLDVDESKDYIPFYNIVNTP
jgi:hypothetical protein